MSYSSVYSPSLTLCPAHSRSSLISNCYGQQNNIMSVAFKLCQITACSGPCYITLSMSYHLSETQFPLGIGWELTSQGPVGVQGANLWKTCWYLASYNYWSYVVTIMSLNPGKHSSLCSPSGRQEVLTTQKSGMMVVLGGCRAASSGGEGKVTITRTFGREVLKAGTKAGREGRKVAHLCWCP